MGWNDHIDEEVHERIDQAVDAGDLEEGSSAHDIALKVADLGLEALTDDERREYEKDVAPALEEVFRENANNERMNMSVVD